MDYAAMLEQHRASGAGLTVACLKVDKEQAQSFGVMTVDAESRVISFSENPRQLLARRGDD
jgi:glucose-1-phosphate adenylyltransferase